LPGFRAIWRCEPTLLQDRESGVATPRKSGRLIASASRCSPSGTSCHTPRCRRPFSAGRGNRCLRSASSAATNATPGRPKSTVQDSPSAQCRQCRVEVSKSTCKKMHFVTHEAHRQGKRVYRVYIDFRNAFNAMSQAALWHVLNMFHIPDVDLLEQIFSTAQQSV